MSLTNTQYRRLVDSAVSAVCPGEGIYISKGRPACVVAQFASRCGVSVKTMRAWEERDEYRIGGILFDGTWSGADVPEGLLERLQELWDWAHTSAFTHALGSHSEDDARLAMLFEIEAAR